MSENILISAEWRFAGIVNDTMPPRDPNGDDDYPNGENDEEEDDEDEDEDDEEKNGQPPVVREPEPDE
jgi:hypothetical protein